MLGAPQLSGIWVGTRRDLVPGGVHRRVSVLWSLKASPGSGRLTGEMQLSGALSTGYRGVLPCNQLPSAAIVRNAEITDGRFTPHLAQWRIKTSQLTGKSACAAYFPDPLRCTAKPAAGGSLSLHCDRLQITLEKVQLTGIWAWNEQRTDRAGDMLVRKQSFHLIQRGPGLVGFVDDLHVSQSKDGQRYRCNGRLQYARQARHRLTGQVRDRNLVFQVTRTIARPGPCQGELKLPDHFLGRWNPLENSLELSFADEKRVLHRLPTKSPAGALTPHH